MEGYSVTEAASILGVPTERVWELLARGVLAGAAEGDTGMRVYLQPRPAPAPPAVESMRSNGGQREPERELSPFRELLTEFRNLTERYGQALLALGEARGEVAALRSRVDLLEARMDLRLPIGSPPPAPAPWPEPQHPPPVARGVPAEVESSAEEEDRPSRRRRSGRRATENFAEALARAEDPTRPELPDAADAAAALTALRAQAAAQAEAAAPDAAEAALPRELPAAEPMPLPDEPDASEPTAIQADAPEPPEPEAESAPAPPPAPRVAPGAPAVSEVGPSTAEPMRWDPERYSAAIEEPDWYVDEEAASAETTTGKPPGATGGSAATEAVDAEPAEPGEPVESGTPDQADQPAESVKAEPPVHADQDEPMPWLNESETATRSEEGADEMEVAGGSRSWSSSEPHLPGSRELDEALAALDALAGRPIPASRADEPTAEPIAEPTSEPTSEARSESIGEARSEPAPPPAWPAVDRRDSPTAEPPRSLAPSSGVEPQRLAATPASRAYRRLRRIFPG